MRVACGTSQSIFSREWAPPHREQRLTERELAWLLTQFPPAMSRSASCTQQKAPHLREGAAASIKGRDIRALIYLILFPTCSLSDVVTRLDFSYSLQGVKSSGCSCCLPVFVSRQQVCGLLRKTVFNIIMCSGNCGGKTFSS